MMDGAGTWDFDGFGMLDLTAWMIDVGWDGR